MMYSTVLAMRVIFPVIITPYLKRLSICPGSLQIPTGTANCRRVKALILYLINTSDEILISIRHGTTLSILSGFSQEENDLLALLKGMLKPCVCTAWHMSDLHSSFKSPSHCSGVIFGWQQKSYLFCTAVALPWHVGILYISVLRLCNLSIMISPYTILEKHKKALNSTPWTLLSSYICVTNTSTMNALLQTLKLQLPNPI